MNLLLGLFLVLPQVLWAQPSPPAIFRLHLANEPSSLDPHQQKTSSSSYLLQNMYRNLFIYNDEKGLIPELGESCQRENPLVLICKLKKDQVWSDGSPITSADFIKAYQRILNPKEAFPRADLLFKIKNAPAIYKGQKKIETLGITAPNSYTLRYEFEEKDPDFEYNLASFALAPVKNFLKPGQKISELIINGPYKPVEWTPGQKIQMVPNALYKVIKLEKRPNVEFLFINEDSVALQLYEKNELSLLRRLPTLYIPKFKKRPDFHWIPMIRFDYIGFGPALKELPQVRESMTQALNYPELQKIFSSEGVPGCPAIPRAWINEDLCYKFDAKKARATLEDNKRVPSGMKLMYSALGGEDHRRATEWMQSQWQKNLGIKIQVLLRDNKVFLSDLQQNTPALFRKGVAPDRPTCLATMETFADWNPENYIQLKDSAYQDILKKLAEAKNPKDQKEYCTQAVRFIMDRHLLIPLGEMHFAILAKPHFTGWTLNAMNQLDLSRLEMKSN